MRKIVLLFIVMAACIPLKAQDTLKGRLESHVYTLAADSMMGRSAGTAYSLKAAQYIIDKFEEIGLKPYVGDSTYRQKFALSGSPERIFTNVIGYIEGSDPLLKDEYVIIGAHYDHLGYKVRGRDTVIYSGADDNASGVAAMLEIARRMKADGKNIRRTVVFAAFDAEESGLYGSAHMAKLMDAGKVKFMMSIDMVGWLKATDELRIKGTGMLKNGKNIMVAIPAPEGLNVKPVKYDKNMMGGSDHDSFARLGIPAFYASTGMKSPYHQPEDTAEKIDYDGLALITEYLAAMTGDFAGGEQLVASGKISPKHKHPKWEFALAGSIGNTLHHYKNGALTGKSAFSWNAGLWAQRNMGTFALRTEVLYHNRVARYPDAAQPVGGDYRRFSTQSVTVPVNLLLKAPGNSPMYFYFNLGIYYAYNLSGEVGGVKLDFDNDVHRHDYGWTFGFGLSLGPAGIAYNSFNGIAPVMRAGEVKMQNRSSYFTMYYRF